MQKTIKGLLLVHLQKLISSDLLLLAHFRQFVLLDTGNVHLGEPNPSGIDLEQRKKNTARS